MKTNHYFSLIKWAGPANIQLKKITANTAATFFLFCSLIISTHVIGQTLTVLSPNGGENWLTGTTQTITWDHTGSPTDLMLEYTIDGGNYWYYLAYVPSTDTSGSYSFQNYLSETSQAKIRVSYYDNSGVSDESDDFFSVTQSPVYFYTPWAGEEYYQTAPLTISWYSATIDTFRVEYTIDNGNSWNLIIDSITSSNYTWTTPNIISSECMIRISNTNNLNQYGLSPVFSIVELPVVTLTTPNGGETWNYGGTATVSYTGTNLPYYMYLDYSTDGGQTWYYLGYAYGSDTGGTAEVYVPYAPTDSARVRVSDPYYETVVFDESDANFTIYVPPVIMYYPYEGQSFYNGSQTSISWLATGIDSVDIALSTDNGQTWQTIEQNVPAYPGYYYWTVSGTPSETCKIRVADASDPSKSGISETFTILETPVITLTSPVGGDIWNTEAAYTISWTYDNPDSYYVYLDYSLDGGLTWNYIGYVLNEDIQGSFEWTTPSTESNQVMIRVTDYYLGFVSDTSAMFSIITFPETPICMVSVDSATNNNIIVWEKPVSDLISDFIVYKESDEANIYQPIGTVSYSDLSVFVDSNSNPAVKSFRYRLGFSDAGGNVYPMGALHQTIHLSINKGVGNSWNLIWTDYLGFDFASYNIYRGSSPDSMNQIASISSSFSSYTDLEATGEYVYYMVEVVNPNGCNPGGRSFDYNRSRSNIATNFSLGVDEDRVIAAQVFPNPANESLQIITGFEKNNDIILAISDLLGRVMIYEEKSAFELNAGYRLNTSELKEGVYLLRLNDGKATHVSKVIVRH